MPIDSRDEIRYAGPEHPFGTRLVRAALLNRMTYEEVEADADGTPQAALVVCLAAAAVAIGSAQAGFSAVAARVVAELLGWLVWSGITYLIGDSLLGGTATWGQLQRTIGFAQAPGLLSVARMVPGMDAPVHVAVALWKLIAAIVAIRQALDFGTLRAVITAVLGFAAYIGLALLLTLLAGMPIAA